MALELDALAPNPADIQQVRDIVQGVPFDQ